MSALRKVYHYTDGSPYFCEACGDLPEGTKIFIDEYKGFNPAYWCEDCVKGKLDNLKFEIIGWTSKEDYLEMQKTFLSNNWPRY